MNFKQDEKVTVIKGNNRGIRGSVCRYNHHGYVRIAIKSDKGSEFFRWLELHKDELTSGWLSKEERKVLKDELEMDRLILRDEQIKAVIAKNIRDLSKKAQEQYIPEGAYCYSERGICPFWEMDPTEPEQENGFCHYLNEGDWDSEGVSLLWDQCKECGVNEQD